MIMDKLLQFDPAGTLGSTVVAASVDSINTLDLLNARDIGIYDDMRREAVFTVLTAMLASGGAAELTIRIMSSADNSTYVTLVASDPIPKANLTAGKQIRIPLPSIAANPTALLPRYLKCNYTGTTHDFTSGTFQCDLVYDAQANNPPTYPAGTTVTN